jgi:hypothetical protein
MTREILSSYQEISALEASLNRLFPLRKLNPSPGKELLEMTDLWSAKVWETGSREGPWPLTEEQISKGLNLARHPLFLCGVHRSGTTLLRDLLDGHPALTVLPSEGSFLTNFAARLNRMPLEERESFLGIRWIRRLINPINQPPYWSLGPGAASASPYVDFARAYRSWYRIAEKNFANTITIWPHLAIVLAYATCSTEPDGGLSARYWVDKTPAHEKYLHTIWREMPEARIIQMVRSPQDVFRSRKRMEPSLNLRSCLRDLNVSYKTAAEQSFKNKGKYLVIRYEALCEAPQSAISQITGFLGIGPEACLLRPTVAGRSAHVNSSFSASLPAGEIIKPAMHSSAGGLSIREQRLLSAYVSRSASRMGYPLKSISRIRVALVKLGFELHQRVLTRLNRIRPPDFRFRNIK